MKAARRSIRPIAALPVIVILVSGYALYSIFDAVRRQAIDDLNGQQLAHARLAARGIETFFADQFNALQLLATTPEIVDPDATFVVDKDKRVVAWNRAIEEMTGIRTEEIVGKGDRAYSVPFHGEARPNLLDLLDGRDPEIEKQYRYVRRRGDVLFTEEFVPKVFGGRGAHVWVLVAPLYDNEGQSAGAIECVRDVTEFKEAETALRRSEENYRLVIENSRDAIFILQGEAIQFSNSRTHHLLGHSSGVHQAAFTGRVHPEDRELASHQQKEILHGHVGNAASGLLVKHGGGETAGRTVRPPPWRHVCTLQEPRAAWRSWLRSDCWCSSRPFWPKVASATPAGTGQALNGRGTARSASRPFRSWEAD